MKIGPYAVTIHAPAMAVYGLADSLRVNLAGIPRLPGATPADVAREALRRNAREVLHAGGGHFKYMWVSDFAKALRGAWTTLDHDYLRGLVVYMTEESARRGRVPSCFTAGHGFDMPWERGDGLPWLVHCWGLLGEAHPALQELIDRYEASHFEGGLVSPGVTGDWVDTILRPSSTYNNVCALHMLRVARALGLRTLHDPAVMERSLLRSRMRADHLIDFAGSSTLSVDGAVYALYLDVFDSQISGRLIDGLEKSGLAEPFPIRCAPHESARKPLLTRLTPAYHESIWLHLGLMYLNALKKRGFDVSARRARVEELIMRHRQVLEAVDERGEPYRSLFLSCEHGLSMAAGQYLELVS